MKVDLFDFDLPEDRIALRPVHPRDAARLLIVSPGADPELADRHVRDLPDLLRPNDLLVLNDTRVLPARLSGLRVRAETSARIELTLHQRITDDTWLAFARPAKRLVSGDLLTFGASGNTCSAGQLEGTVTARGEAGEVTVRFDRAGPFLDEALHTVGTMPLPPYIAARRPEDERDLADYQTTFARVEGAVAAPTAGLHLTPELLARLAERGIGHSFVTLHVGAGTFLPVKAADTDEHRMHAEWGEVTAATVDAIHAARAGGGRIVCVGTTSLRLLESAARDGDLRPWSGATDIFITPGYRFAVADLLVTNFHLPRSTLFMLVSAFAGLDMMQRAYRHAIESGYRFYSYGDASLLSLAADAGRGRHPSSNPTRHSP